MGKVEEDKIMGPPGGFLLKLSEGQNYQDLGGLRKKVLRVMNPEKGLCLCYVYIRTPEVL